MSINHVSTIPGTFGTGGSGLNPTADPTNNLQKILSDHVAAINALIDGGGQQTSTAVTWKLAMTAFAQSKYPTLNSDPLFVDILQGTTGDYSTAIQAGNGVANVSGGFRGGVLELDTGSTTTNGSRIAVQGKGVPILATNMLTGAPWFIAARALTITGVDATGANTIIGFADAGFSSIPGIKLLGATSTTHYLFTVSGTTTIDTGVAVDTVHFKDFGVGFDGVTLTGFIGDVLAGTFVSVGTSTDLTGLVSGPGSPYSHVAAGSGAVRIRMELDKLFGMVAVP